MQIRRLNTSYAYYSGNNPVLPIDEDVLAAQAAKIAEQNPVTTFLTSSAFTSVAPDGVEVRVTVYVSCEHCHGI